MLRREARLEAEIFLPIQHGRLSAVNLPIRELNHQLHNQTKVWSKRSVQKQRPRRISKPTQTQSREIGTTRPKLFRRLQMQR
jgi:hypothetical protein